MAKRYGFTLIEVIIAALILAITAALAIPKFVELRDQAMLAAEDHTVGAIREGIGTTSKANIVRGIRPIYPAHLDNAPTGKYSSQTPFFENVLQSVVANEWEKLDLDLYKSPTGKHYRYDPETGTFQEEGGSRPPPPPTPTSWAYPGTHVNPFTAVAGSAFTQALGLNVTSLFTGFQPGGIFSSGEETALTVGEKGLYGGGGSDTVTSVQQTFDANGNADGYIIAGYTTSFGQGMTDAYITKIGLDGSILWSKTYGGPNGDYATSIQQTFDGGYVMTGYALPAGSSTGYDAFVTKLNAQGGVEWNYKYGRAGGEYPSNIQQTADGGYITTGYTNSVGAGNYDAYVTKLRPNGTVEWSKAYGASGTEYGRFVQQTQDGGYILGMESATSGAGLVKLDAGGNITWKKSYGDGRSYFMVSSVEETSDGNYIVAGKKVGGTQTAYLSKIDPAGNIIWSKNYSDSGPNSQMYTVAAQETSAGGYVISGTITIPTTGGINDIYIIETDSNGTPRWAKSYGGDKTDYGVSIQETQGGGYVIGGYTISFTSSAKYDLYAIKTDSEGDIQED